MKTCTVCGKVKAATEFYRMKTAKDGLLPRCKACHDTYHKNKRAKARVIRDAEKTEILKRGKKTCTKCGESKPFSDFHPQKDGFGGVRGDCKACVNALHLAWVAANGEKKKALDKEYRSRPDVKVELAAYYKEYRKTYYPKNRKRINAKVAECTKRRKLVDPTFKMLCALRGRLRDVVKDVRDFRDYRSGRKSLLKQLIGCTPDELRTHLESQFQPGMTWENYNLHGWHVDHRVPCAHFDLSDFEELKKCFHYTNLQPKWAKENWSKGSRFIG